VLVLVGAVHLEEAVEVVDSVVEEAAPGEMVAIGNISL
jgi:hypothetical protein